MRLSLDVDMMVVVKENGRGFALPTVKSLQLMSISNAATTNPSRRYQDYMEEAICKGHGELFPTTGSIHKFVLFNKMADADLLLLCLDSSNNSSKSLFK